MALNMYREALIVYARPFFMLTTLRVKLALSSVVLCYSKPVN